MTSPRPLTTVKEGPVYRALERASAEFLGEIAGYDVKTLASFDHAPIEAVRAFAAARGVVPHAELFGEEFEREAVKAWQRWYTERDSESVVNLLASLLLVNIDAAFLGRGAHAGTVRVAVAAAARPRSGLPAIPGADAGVAAALLPDGGTAAGRAVRELRGRAAVPERRGVARPRHLLHAGRVSAVE